MKIFTYAPTIIFNPFPIRFNKDPDSMQPFVFLCARGNYDSLTKGFVKAAGNAARQPG
jgi:hypothetical protein